MNRKKRSNVERERLITEILRALDGKYGRTYPLMLVRRIRMLQDIPDQNERKWLCDELLRLIQTGDTNTLRQIADARDRDCKAGEVFNLKRYKRLRAYSEVVYKREGRLPEIKEIVNQLQIPSDDEKRMLNEIRAIRKLLKDCNLPYKNVATGRPKGTTNLKKSERLRGLRSLLLR